MSKEYIKELFRLREGLLDKQEALRAPVEKNYDPVVYRQKKKLHAARMRALDRQTFAITAGINALEMKQ